MIQERKLGALALLRNLRNMRTAQVDEVVVLAAIRSVHADRFFAYGTGLAHSVPVGVCALPGTLMPDGSVFRDTASAGSLASTASGTGVASLVHSVTSVVRFS